MLIQSLIIRPNFTLVEFDDAQYLFKPRPELGTGDKHVAEVTNTDHVTKLLVTEAYALVEDPARFSQEPQPPTPPAAQTTQEPVALTEEPSEEPPIEQQGVVTESDSADTTQDPASSGKTTTEEEAHETLIARKDYDNMTEEELNIVYKARVGRKPRDNYSDATVLKHIQKADEKDAEAEND